MKWSSISQAFLNGLKDSLRDVKNLKMIQAVGGYQLL